ncbi:MAG: DUF3105 domain-containing protein [Actinomycetes bacterium]
MAKNPTSSSRAAKVAAMQAEQARKERRWRLGIALAAAVPVIALLAAFLIPFVTGARDTDRSASGPIEGVQTFTGLSANHVTSPVTYAQNPPVGGDHSGVWQNCGIYTSPITPIEPAVHSLEHGAVWITYDPALPTDQVARLQSLVRGKPYGLLSPMQDVPALVVASAWGVQLQVESASDPRLPTFLSTYMQGPQTPEPGASCFGGLGTPDA